MDMVIAAKTGQGKTLCFGIPIIDLLCKRLQKGDEEFNTVKALIISPTRELAIQIKDHIQAIVPVEHSDKIKLCPIVGGMSIQKQERLLSYNPTIIIATPGRLWELLNERANQYLVSELPMIDVLVLDEADRMIEDGHFKEMKMILDFVYNKRVEYKKQGINPKAKTPVDPALLTEEDQKKRAYKEQVLAQAKSIKDTFVLKELEGTAAKVDLSKIVDLYDEDGIMEEISPDNLVIEESQKKEKGTFRNKKLDKKAEEKKRVEEEEQFAREYKKMGGI